MRIAEETRTNGAYSDAEATARRAKLPAQGPPPLPDGGAPMGARDDRPAMLGRRFRLTEVVGMLIGLTLALVGNALISQLWISRDTSGWTWPITALGGIAVGGALTLFIYGVSTDRTDTGPKPCGRADVSTEGEERRTRHRMSQAAARGFRPPARLR